MVWVGKDKATIGRYIHVLINVPINDIDLTSDKFILSTSVFNNNFSNLAKKLTK